MEAAEELQHVDKKKLLIGGGVAAAILFGVIAARKNKSSDTTVVDTGATAPLLFPTIPKTGQTTSGSSASGNTLGTPVTGQTSGGSTSTPVVVTTPATVSTTPPAPAYDPGTWYQPPQVITTGQTSGGNGGKSTPVTPTYNPPVVSAGVPVTVSPVPAQTAAKIVPVVSGQTANNVTDNTAPQGGSGYTPPMTNQERYLSGIISDPGSSQGQIAWANQELYLETLKSTGTSGQAAWAQNELATMNSGSSDIGSSIDTNQRAYLTDLIDNGSSGQRSWAQDQFAQAGEEAPMTNQQQYLEDLVAQGGGNGEWAQAQLDSGNY